MSETKSKETANKENANKENAKEHKATAKALNIPISTKNSVEISKFLRYKTVEFAKRYLEEVVQLKKAVPFKSHVRDLGHKRGIGAGRYPQKAAKEFLKLVKSVEANAQFKGLNTSSLKIVKLLANQAGIPLTGGRHRRGTKRTHLEIEVMEQASNKGSKSSKGDKGDKGEKRVQGEKKREAKGNNPESAREQR
jgi:large subunit ribosomal protein L22